MSRSISIVFSSRSFTVSGLYVQVYNSFGTNFCIWCKDPNSFFCTCLPSLVNTICKRYYSFPVACLVTHIEDYLAIYTEFISGLSAMFHWCICLSLPQYHTFLITATRIVLKSGSVRPLALFFVKIVLAIQSLLTFHMNLRMVLLYFQEKMPLRFW